MATITAARSILRSNAARNAVANLVNATKSKSSGCSTSPKNLLSPRIFRCPVELSACLETMQPFHTATASALMTSMVSITRHTHAWLIDVLKKRWTGNLPSLYDFMWVILSLIALSVNLLLLTLHLSIS